MDQLFDSLKGIILTNEAKKPQRELWIILNEEKAQILNDPVRRKLLAIFREGLDDSVTTEEYNSETKEKIIREKQVKRYCLSVSEIVHQSASFSKDEILTRNQVYHHLPLLIDGGYLINFGTVINGKRETTYFRRTAKNIIVAAGSHLDAENDYLTQQSKIIVNEYSTLFTKTFHVEEKDELVKLVAKAGSLQLQMLNEFSKQINQDVTNPKQIEILQNLMDIYAIGNSEYVSTQKKIYSILFKK